jgi:hypothetical protein
MRKKSERQRKGVTKGRNKERTASVESIAAPASVNNFTISSEPEAKARSRAV